MDFLLRFLGDTWLLTAEMAPYLILGFGVAGLLHVFLPIGFVTRHLGGETLGPVTKASLLGIPLPLCSCGVLPVAASLRTAGAGKAPTLSFLITTPVTGVDSLAATWALMGWLFTLVRLGVSLAIGMAVGIIMMLIDRTERKPAEPLADDRLNMLPATGADCVACEVVEPKQGWTGKLRDAATYGFVELPVNIASSIMVGLLLGGLITAALPPGFVAEHLGVGLLGLLVSVAVAVPLYVCSTGSIPIAAGMMVAGFSPGAALAFLIAGPATNMVAMTTVRRLLGGRALAVYLSAIFFGALGFGLLFDLLLPAGNSWVHAQMTHVHGEHGLALWKIVGGVVLLAGIVVLYLKNSPWLKKIFRRESGQGEDEMENRVRFQVPDMTCNHCKTTVTKALKAFGQVDEVDVDLDTKDVKVSLNAELDEQAMLDALKRAGFEAGVK